MLSHRPQIKPGLRQVWRDDATLQIGLTPEHGVVVTGLAPFDVRLIGQLDGTRRVSDLSRWARTHGAPPERVHRLLDLLAGAGVLTGPPTDRAHLQQLGTDRQRELRPDAQAWSVTYADAGDGYELLARRTRRPVLLVGRGRLADSCATAMVKAALAVRRAETMRAALIEIDPTVSGGGDRSAYRLVVLVDDDAASTALGSALMAESLPHLAVLAGADRAGVGPLVVPGRSACLHCVELARTDRDPGWPAVAAQLDAPAPAERGEVSLTRLAAALAALQVACWADGRRTPASVGATLSVTLPDGLTTRRVWRRHPRCPCSWSMSSAADRVG